MRAARAVVIGRSDIVGKPMALLLLHAHATVHDLPLADAGFAARWRAEADILVAAHWPSGVRDAGFREARRGRRRRRDDAVTDRATIERLFAPGSKRREAFERRGSLVVGDVHPDGRGVAGALTPGARRRRSADDRDAAQEHARGGREARAAHEGPSRRE